MKKLIANLITTLICTVVVILLTAPGCGDERENNVGYHYVIIPGYNDSDYMSMLNSTNAEIQYNAICYLYENMKTNQPAIDYDSLKGTREYDSIMLIYRKVLPMVNSKNSWVSSAAIRYLSVFKYNRPEFMRNLLNYENPSLNVQLEIVKNVNADTINDQNLISRKFNFLQKQPSWLLQNIAYGIFKEKDNIPINQLINDYNTSGAEYKKLLILNALSMHITDSVFYFLSNEWERTTNERIKNIIFFSLLNSKNEEMAFNWYEKHLPLVEENMDQFIHWGNNTSFKIIERCIEKGWQPSSVLTGNNFSEFKDEPLLYSIIFINKNQIDTTSSESLYNAKRWKIIEEKILRDPKLKQEWLSFVDRYSEYPLPAEFIIQHRQITEDYLRKTRLLANQFQFDTTFYHEFEGSIHSASINLQGEKMKRKK